MHKQICLILYRQDVSENIPAWQSSTLGCCIHKCQFDPCDPVPKLLALRPLPQPDHVSVPQHKAIKTEFQLRLIVWTMKSVGHPYEGSQLHPQRSCFLSIPLSLHSPHHFLHPFLPTFCLFLSSLARLVLPA